MILYRRPTYIVKAGDTMSNGADAREQIRKIFCNSPYIKHVDQFNYIGINGNDLRVFNLILSFNANNQAFSGGYQYVAKRFDMQERTVIRIINKLIKNKYIKKAFASKGGAPNTLEINWDFVAQKLNTDKMSELNKITLTKCQSEHCQNVRDNTDKMSPNKNIYNNRIKEVVEERTSSASAVPHDEKENSKGIVSENSEALSKVLEMYRENICMAHNQYLLNSIEADELKKLVKEHSADMVEKAIKRAVKRGKYNLGYIEAILNDWKENGYDDGKAPAPPKQKQTEQLKTEAVYLDQEMSIGWEGRE